MKYVILGAVLTVLAPQIFLISASSWVVHTTLRPVIGLLIPFCFLGGGVFSWYGLSKISKRSAKAYVVCVVIPYVLMIPLFAVLYYYIIILFLVTPYVNVIVSLVLGFIGRRKKNRNKTVEKKGAPF